MQRTYMNIELFSASSPVHANIMSPTMKEPLPYQSSATWHCSLHEGQQSGDWRSCGVSRSPTLHHLHQPSIARLISLILRNRYTSRPVYLAPSPSPPAYSNNNPSSFSPPPGPHPTPDERTMLSASPVMADAHTPTTCPKCGAQNQNSKTCPSCGAVSLVFLFSLNASRVTCRQDRYRCMDPSADGLRLCRAVRSRGL